MADGNFLSRAVLAVRYTLSGVTPETWMSPQQPLPPQAQQAVGRQYDYPAAYNLNYLPRSDRRTKYPQLKLLSESCGMLRTVIERQKDLLESFDWNIKPRETAPGKRPGAGSDKSILAIEAFLRYPDRIHDWAQWLRALLDQVFVYDALTIYRRRDLAGRPFAFELMDGARIRLLIDGSGRRPFPPDPAYQQILKGVPAVDYTTDDLLYWPKNVRADSPYGYPPVEQILDYVETSIQRTASQKSYFTEGNLVDGLFSGPVEWKSEQIKAWQGYWDSLFSGNVAMRRKGFWVPNGTEFKEIKQPPLKDDFDEWLARVICFAFSTSPQPFIKQVARGNQENQQEVAEEGGVAVYMQYIKRVMDRLVSEDFSRPDLEFVWSDDREFDPMVAAQINDLRLRNGSLVINEVRDANGEDPLPDGDTPLIYTATGAVTLDQVINPPDPPAPVIMHPGAQPGADPANANQPKPDAKPEPKTAAAKLAKAAQKRVTTDRPKARRAARNLIKAFTPILAKAGKQVAEETKTRLMAMGKAADDSGDHIAMATAIANAVSLQALDDFSDAAFDDLFLVAEDSAGLALASVGASADGLTDQVFQRAVDFAKARAAEMVSAQGDDSIVASTRNMIRDVIAQGLGDNIGSAKIADAVEASAAFSPDRAQLIARTEIANANGQGKLAGWNEAASLGIDLEKFWDADAEACPVCLENEAASPIGLNDDFPSGDDAEPAHPRCECATYALPVEDE